MGSVGDDIRQAFSRGNGSHIQLILINLFVFIGLFGIKFILSLAPETKALVPAIDENFLFSTDVPTLLTHPWTILTYGFTNRSILGLLFNAISLFWFGMIMQDFLGNRKLLNVYFLGYIFAGLFYFVLFHLVALLKLNFTLPLTLSGSTPAVYAVMFAAITLVPDYEFYLFRSFYVKIKYLALLFLVLSFLQPAFGLLNLGGAFLGYLYIKLLRLGVDLGSPIESIQDWFRGIRTPPKSSKKPTTKRFSHSTVGHSLYQAHEEGDFLPDQEEIDSLLDKISVSGYDSLTRQEKERLHLASKNQKL
ncbi:rhomboid family intramembrane serine protease [Marinilongibacter aquaticus]|uniref:rhomboid family intramembrane serine protease n=1 Tax=Marinilongibacter aquaticus TaxID=2975157 RepID=UPI0021BCFF86|nr:rhomboid family intramembrane serine protease [Marinilongibacter aquaticus]UBM57459.1 rhomboid family intramembrane serine protease [Marinilongibacter aquaticus]